jgi:peroxiredoxin Q/BCP
MITVGTKAPSFTLPDEDDNPVRLADYKGQWVVLYFYPRDDTPGCTKEACEFTAGIRGFKTLDAVVLGCSPDTPERHRAFVKKYSLKMTLLSDPKHVVMEKYGGWGEKVLYGKATIGVRRSTVIVDPSGMVAYHWRAVKAAGHADKVQEKVAALARRGSVD